MALCLWDELGARQLDDATGNQEERERMKYTKGDIQHLAYLFYSGVPFDTLTDKEQAIFIAYQENKRDNQS